MGPRDHGIAKDEIHIHYLHFREGFPSLPRRIWERRLPPEEGSTAAGLARGLRKWEFLWSRLLLCHLCARYLGVDPRSVEFARSKGGRPFLKGTPIRFSLSHTEGFVACSFGYGRFGIDIERFRDGTEDRARWKILARRFLSRCERRYIDTHPEGRRRSAAFLEIFTLKEAYGKALGRGLAVLGDRSAIPLPARKWRRWGRWEYITGYPVRSGYRLAHIAEIRGGHGRRYRMYSWNRSALTRVFPPDPSPDL